MSTHRHLQHVRARQSFRRDLHAVGSAVGSHATALILTETPDLRRAQLVADAAGLPHVVFFGDLAIVSQAPIRDVKRQRVDPPGNLSSNDSIILAVQTDTRLSA